MKTLTFARNTKIVPPIVAFFFALLSTTALPILMNPPAALAGSNTYPTSIAGCRAVSGSPSGYFSCDIKDSAQDTYFDPWAEENRECTSYAAWMLSSVNGFTMPFFDDAVNWGPDASSRGYTVNMTPAVGSIYWSSSSDHVAYVEYVSSNGSTVNTVDYNAGYPTNPGLWSENIGVATSSASGYIHFKDGGDTTPPSTPPNFTSIIQNGLQVLLNWGASTDNVGVTGYTISRTDIDGSNAVTLATVSASTLSYTDVPASQGKTYIYTVKASDAAGNLSAPATTQVTVPADFKYSSQKADFNGDGKDDVLIAHPSGAGGVNYWVFTSTGSGLNAPVLWSYQSTFSWADERIVAADIDGDGKKDLVVMHRAGTDGVNLWWFRSLGTSFASPVLLSNPAGFSYNSSKITAADFNGDGKDDIEITHISGTDAVNYWVFTSTGSGLNAPVLWSYQSTFSWSNEQVVATDIDGDGKKDLVVMHRAGTDGVNLWWLRSTGTGFASPTGLITPVSGFSYNSSKITAADFNGDLKGDISIAHISGTDAVNYWVFTSTGSGLNGPVNWLYLSTFSWSNEQILPADLNGDGKADLVIMHRAGTDGVNLYWLPSTGTSFTGPTGLIDPVSGFSYNSSKLV